jgi:hypothetical protein
MGDLQPYYSAASPSITETARSSRRGSVELSICWPRTRRMASARRAGRTRVARSSPRPRITVSLPGAIERAVTDGITRREAGRLIAALRIIDGEDGARG